MLLFEVTIKSLYRLNDEKGIIDFGVSEDLCDLIDEITVVAELTLKKYANRKGISNT
ncbi:hypothetical protein [Flavobacterium hydatis]|uniref:hypothetical protein n=1 Tax=Flavobacterium hydatis TaxID=991 RepID=UPI000A43242B|nr:hypothetical protein [Flavobacterium hydatis]